MSAPLPRIAITPGEPAGIGPDLCLMLAQRQLPLLPVFVCDPSLLQDRARQLGMPCTTQAFDPDNCTPPGRGGCTVLPVGLRTAVTCGRPAVDNARYVLETLDRAVAGCLSGQFDALVTGPVQKSVINEAGIAFTGHTEYIASATGTAHVVMLLATDSLRVALATTHVPLAEVSRLITADRLDRVIRILHGDLVSRFGIRQPRIRVCGLNPHAGEAGHLGHEERDIISPLVESLRGQGIDVSGPWPADSVFTPDSIAACDAILAMYHDQGLPVLKHSGFGRAVNITLGLPMIRTSVDHGTALDLAGTGRADSGSLETAIHSALQMVSRTR